MNEDMNNQETEANDSISNPYRDLRLLVVSDFHCGHESGLTPPAWNVKAGLADHMHEYREILYGSFDRLLNLFRPFDICTVNGDLIDGRGEKSGGTELIYVDRQKQAEMAADIIGHINAPRTYITRGTDYHVGHAESWENLIAKEVNAEKIGDIINLDINGTLFNFRHHIGGSQTPVGRSTSLAREIVWNELWASRKGFSKANAIVRSHVHYHMGVIQPGYLAITTPALQGYGSRYGERRISGIIDFGITVFDIKADGTYTWTSQILDYPTVEPEIIR